MANRESKEAYVVARDFTSQLVTGVSRVVEQPGLLRSHPEAGKRAILTNAAATLADFSRNLDGLVAAGVHLDLVLSPEHGFWGSAQAAAAVAHSRDQKTDLPVLDTYRNQAGELDELLRANQIGEVVVDLPDLGTRFYTYVSTLFDLVASAARTHTRVVVLDRPNPLAYLGPQGPGVEPEHESFVGRANIPLLHGRSLGELAIEFQDLLSAEGDTKACDLEVITASNWDRSRPPVHAAWVSPSPNIPTFNAALVYAGTCLFEGTNVSEGRGTTRPFETVGAPWVDHRLADALRQLEIPGVAFQECEFVPSFSKWQGEVCHGVQIHVLNVENYRPIETALEILRLIAVLYPEKLEYITFSEHSGFFIDRLWGSSTLRTHLRDGSVAEVLARSPRPNESTVHPGLYGPEKPT